MHISPPMSVSSTDPIGAEEQLGIHQAVVDQNDVHHTRDKTEQECEDGRDQHKCSNLALSSGMLEENIAVINNAIAGTHSSVETTPESTNTPISCNGVSEQKLPTQSSPSTSQVDDCRQPKILIHTVGENETEAIISPVWRRNLLTCSDENIKKRRHASTLTPASKHRKVSIASTTVHQDENSARLSSEKCAGRTVSSTRPKKSISISLIPAAENGEGIIAKRHRHHHHHHSPQPCTHSSTTSASRVPWTGFYFGCNEDTDVAERAFRVAGLRNGLVACSECGQHVYNGQLIGHCLLHLQMDEHRSGSLQPHTTCFDCLAAPPTLEQLPPHRKLHQRVANSLVLKTNTFHLPGNRRVCCICEKAFDTVLDLAAHMCYKHPASDTPYVCTICFSFRSSIYAHLLLHLLTYHNSTNQIFCPFCLKHFSLPLVNPKYSAIARQLPNTNVFSSAVFYGHLAKHLTVTNSHQCSSCRLQFLDKRECKIHEYLHHAGGSRLHSTTLIPPVCQAGPSAANPADVGEDYIDDTGEVLATQAAFDQLRFCIVRTNLKCSECDEVLRAPYQRHFAARVTCPWCGYTSHCATANVAHWQRVHNRSIFAVRRRSPELYNITYNSPAYLKIPETTRDLIMYEACGGWQTALHYCTKKHAAPGLLERGLLVCGCGFRSLRGNQMATHLATEVCGYQSVRLDKEARTRESCYITIDDEATLTETRIERQDLDEVPRLLDTLRVIKRAGLRTATWWHQRTSDTPLALRSVGLFGPIKRPTTLTKMDDLEASHRPAKLCASSELRAPKMSESLEHAMMDPETLALEDTTEQMSIQKFTDLVRTEEALEPGQIEECTDVADKVVRQLSSEEKCHEPIAMTDSPDVEILVQSSEAGSLEKSPQSLTEEKSPANSYDGKISRQTYV